MNCVNQPENWNGRILTHENHSSVKYTIVQIVLTSTEEANQRYGTLAKSKIRVNLRCMTLVSKIRGMTDY
jgi:hypothetical protein